MDGKGHQGEAEKQETRAKERILRAWKSRVLHFVWHFPNTAKSPGRVINENKGTVAPGAFSAFCHILHVRKTGKVGQPEGGFHSPLTSSPGRGNGWAWVLEIKQD